MRRNEGHRYGWSELPSVVFAARVEKEVVI